MGNIIFAFKQLEMGATPPYDYKEILLHIFFM